MSVQQHYTFGQQRVVIRWITACIGYPNWSWKHFNDKNIINSWLSRSMENDSKMKMGEKKLWMFGSNVNDCPHTNPSTLTHVSTFKLSERSRHINVLASLNDRDTIECIIWMKKSVKWFTQRRHYQDTVTRLIEINVTYPNKVCLI